MRDRTNGDGVVQTRLTPDQARQWLVRWEECHADFLPMRAEREEVVCDVVQAAVRRPDPLVVELGAGPGPLACRLAERLPAAHVVAVDSDPLLLGLGRVSIGDRPDLHARVRFVEADLTRVGWWDMLGLDRAPEAVVSSTALHYLPAEQLRDVITQAVESLAVPGVFVDLDQIMLGSESTAIDDLARALDRRLLQRQARAVQGESTTWPQWWQAASAAPELAELWRQHEHVGRAPSTSTPGVLPDYEQALQDAGCRAVGTVWQVGSDRVVIGLR